MTEEEWLTTTSFGQLLSNFANREYFPESERKLRLLVCARCRRTESSSSYRDRQRLAVAEAFADGAASRGQLLAGRAVNPGKEVDTYEAFLWAATYPSNGKPSRNSVIVPALNYFQCLLYQSRLGYEVGYIRDIFENPFRPTAFSPEWHTDTVVALARQMYESRDFSAMPILADALQDAGCDSTDVLDHCRGPGPHVRGCWVVDLVLGKQ